MSARKARSRAYVVRLEWASTISYCDVAVMASSPAEAVKKAGEDCDYDAQRNYDDGGETYCGAVIRAGSMERAEEIIDNGELWDIPHLPIPLDEKDPQCAVFDLKEQIAFLRAALTNAHTALAQARTGTIDRVALDNNVNKVAFVLANVGDTA